MKTARIVLSVIACLSAIVGSFASHFEKPLQTYYGVSGGSCTALPLSAGESGCNKASGIRCTVVTPGSTVVNAFSAINTATNPDQCVTPVFRTN